MYRTFTRDKNLCDTITSFNTFFSRDTNFSSMLWSSFFNNWWWGQYSLCWQCMVYYKHLWNLWNGNTWPLYVHIGRPDVTLVGLAAQDVLLSSFLPPGKRLLNSYLRNDSIDLNNSRCIWKPVVYRGAPYPHKSTSPQGWSWSQSMIPIAASPMLRLSDYWVGSRDNPNRLKLAFSV